MILYCALEDLQQNLKTMVKFGKAENKKIHLLYSSVGKTKIALKSARPW